MISFISQFNFSYLILNTKLVESFMENILRTFLKLLMFYCNILKDFFYQINAARLGHLDQIIITWSSFR